VAVGMVGNGKCGVLLIVYPDLFCVDRGAGYRELLRGAVDIEG